MSDPIEDAVKHVLITGATGVIGSRLVPLLLEETETRLTLLIRASSDQHLQERLNELLDFWEIDPSDPKVSRLSGVSGDISRTSLGIPLDSYRNLAKTVTHVIHCAGNVKLNQPMAEARRDAVTASENILRFAEECRKNGHLEKVDVTSTVGVAGRMEGLVPEKPILTQSGFHNTYEAAKAESEIRLLSAMDGGMPLTIHRPSMVVGDSETGKIIHFQIFYHLCELLSGNRTWGVVPDTGDFRLDIVPVDYVARAIHLSSADPASIGRIFHLCSGPEHAFALSELNRYSNLSKMGGAPRILPRFVFSRILPSLRWVFPKRVRRVLRNLPYFLVYLEDLQTFDNAETRDYLSRKGLYLPAPLDYLSRIMEYYARQSA